MEVTIRSLSTVLNVFDIYSLFHERKDCILLESSSDHDRLGRYSFIGLNPFKKITYKNGVVKEDGISRPAQAFQALKQSINAYTIENKTALPFIGGCMGYLAYDLVRDLEKLPDDTEDIVDIPSLYFVFYDHIIIYDHQCQKVYVTELARVTGQVSQIDKIVDQIARGKAQKQSFLEANPVEFVSPFSGKAYMQAVETMRSYIKSGDIYIANMTHTFTGRSQRCAYDIYSVLRQLNQAPFSAYLPLDGFEVMCSSPERFIQVHEGEVETRPIKGTRPRGTSPEEDAQMRLELEESEKDRSELLMIVDLERNDLSKVCQAFSVKVTELFKCESYATVHHLVATVVGRLRGDQSAVDLIRACFPGGSITGTPKIRAMEVIEELEKTRRNLYTGCIGYFGFDGGCDFNIVIRTIVKQGDQVSIGVGGGVTWESDAAAEYQETLDKAGVLFEAVAMCEVERDESTFK